MEKYVKLINNNNIKINTTNTNDIEIDNSYVVFDFETTGLSCVNNEIIEIGAIKVKNGHIIETFETLIKPEKQISHKITEITGITNDMVNNKPTINEVLPLFIDFIEELPLVAHNIRFDYSFLNENYKRIYGKEFLCKKYCTIEMYRKWYQVNYSQKAPSAKLGDVISTLLGNENYSNYLKNAHRGLNDATFTQKIYEKIISSNNALI